MTNRHMKRLSALLTIKERQIKTTKRYHLILVRLAIMKKSTNKKCWSVEKKKHSYTVGGNVNLCSRYGELYGGSLKKLNIELPYDLAMPLLGIYPKKNLFQKMHES